MLSYKAAMATTANKGKKRVALVEITSRPTKVEVNQEVTALKRSCLKVPLAKTPTVVLSSESSSLVVPQQRLAPPSSSFPTASVTSSLRL